MKYTKPASHTPALSQFYGSAGFTLLELLVVIVIIGMLAGYVAPRYFAQLGKSESTVAKSQMDALSKAIDTYRLDTGHYPDTQQGLEALVKKPASETQWNGPYLKKNVPLDPWGRAYLYTLTSTGNDYEISSLGKDGVVGGLQENQDITNN